MTISEIQDGDARDLWAEITDKLTDELVDPGSTGLDPVTLLEHMQTMAQRLIKQADRLEVLHAAPLLQEPEWFRRSMLERVWPPGRIKIPGLGVV